MAEKKATRLSKIAREFNVGINTIVDFLNGKGYKIDTNPNTKITPDLYEILEKEYSKDISAKKESEQINLRSRRTGQQAVTLNDVPEEELEESSDQEKEFLIKDTRAGGAKGKIEKKEEPEKEEKPKVENTIKVVGKIDIDQQKKEAKKETEKAKVKEEKEKAPKKEDKTEAKSKTEEKDTSEDQKPKAEETQKSEEKPKDDSKKKSTSDKDKKAAETAEKEESEKKEKKSKKEEIKDKENIEDDIKEDIPEAEAEVDVKANEPTEEEIRTNVEKLSGPTVVGKIDLSSMNQKTRPSRKTKEEKEAERKGRAEEKKTESAKKSKGKEEKEGVVKTDVEKLSGPTVVGKIKLKKDQQKKPVASSSDDFSGDKKKKRKRIKKDKEKVDVDSKDAKKGSRVEKKSNKKRKRIHKNEIKDEDVQQQIKDTLARLTNKGKTKSSKYRREKRDAVKHEQEQETQKQEQDQKVLKVTEFVSVSELASMMDIQGNELIQTCMNMGLFVSINQRLDAETMSLLADEYGYTVDFVSVEVQEAIRENEDTPEELESRSPIVTVMGHVDHGKTKLLDYIRKANVIAGEAGGITQHIGAYSVSLDDGRQITFLDTPGHEAFTAMRARGAQVTDVAIIVVAADDGVKPQTVEAINHASAAGVPIVFAINKIDKPTANPEKVKEELANMNFLVEDWGGKYQSQEISSIKGTNVDDLLDKVLLEAELLELQANPNKKAHGTVIESTLDRGRGYVATILVESGKLKMGDILLAGQYFGHVKAMFNERGHKIDEAGPSTPVVVLGLNGAPQAGDKFNIIESDKEAKEIATKRSQLQREQETRTQKHITLDEIGRRIAIGDFQELNIIVKGDVDGSIEALADSLIKLSTEQIQVNIKHKAVGQISESDILLAAASDAIIIGFQVRPSMNARKLAEREQIDIRLYSIIYDAIEDVKAAMEGMLSPDIKEEVVATLEVLETFKITKVGTIAGCLVREGKILRNNKIRLIREGIVIYAGNLGSLKRFKDDVKEVNSGYECGLNIENYNDIKVGDIIEAYKEVEVARKL